MIEVLIRKVAAAGCEESVQKHFKAFIELGLVILAVIAIFKILDLLKNKISKTLSDKHKDSMLLRFIPILDRFLKILAAIVIVLMVLQYHGIPVNTIIAGLGVGGVAIGFAAKETIANIFGSVALIADKAYKLGDHISINQTIGGADVEGIVEDINLRSTKIRANDQAVCIIPNNIVANSTVKNHTLKGQKIE